MTRWIARTVVPAVALLLAVGLVSLGAEDRRELVAPFLRALEARAGGEIEGRAFGEPKRPNGPPTPYEGVSLIALPYAAEIEAQLDAIRRHQRDTMASYTEAHADVTAVRAAYERELLAAGAGELIRGAVSDAGGVVRLEGVPAGEWLLLGWREENHAVKAARTPSKDAGRFSEVPVTTGYAAVSYWRLRVSVRAGETTTVNLSDRAIWLTAVREELTHPDGGKRPSSSKKRR